MYTVTNYVDPKGQPAVEEYAMLRGNDGMELATKVNNLLRTGWVLYGLPFSSGSMVAQAMGKYMNNKKLYE